MKHLTRIFSGICLLAPLLASADGTTTTNFLNNEVGSCTENSPFPSNFQLLTNHDGGQKPSNWISPDQSRFDHYADFSLVTDPVTGKISLGGEVGRGGQAFEELVGGRKRIRTGAIVDWRGNLQAKNQGNFESSDGVKVKLTETPPNPAEPIDRMVVTFGDTTEYSAEVTLPNRPLPIHLTCQLHKNQLARVDKATASSVASAPFGQAVTEGDRRDARAVPTQPPAPAREPLTDMDILRSPARQLF